MMTLYHYWLCPFCRTVRLVLNEKNIEYNLIIERYWEKREDFLKLNKSGQVPFLEDISGNMVVGSGAIIEYIKEKYDTKSALEGKDFEHRLKIISICDWLNQTFYSQVSHMMLYEKVLKRHMKEGGPDSLMIRRANDNMRNQFEYLSSLIEQENYLAGSELTLADLTAAAHISCLDYISIISWDKYPEVRDWYAKVKSRPSFRPILEDHVPAITPPPFYKELDF